MKYLLDTNTLVYYFNGDSEVIEAMEKAGHKNLYITPLTQGELAFGAHYSQKKAKNLRKLWRFFSKVKKLPLTDDVINQFGEIKAYLESTGKRIDDHDIWNGAFGKVYGMAVVTNNVMHFKRIEGLKIKNWVKKKSSKQGRNT